MNYQLYDLAYQLYKANPWKILRATDIFAIPLSGGRTGYVCVSSTDDPGKENDILDVGAFEYNLSLLPDQASLDMFRAALLRDYPDMGDSYLHKRRIMLFYAGKEELRGHNEELAAVREYEKQAGHKFTKGHSPVFVSEEPYQMGNSYLRQEQEEDMIAAMQYTLEMLTELRSSDKKTLGFMSFMIDGSQQTIPMIEEINGVYQIRPLTIPALQEPTYPPVIADNELLMHALSKRKKTGTWFCQLGGVLTEDFENENYFFPMMIFATGSKNPEEPVCTEKAFDYEEHPENLLNQFLQCLFNARTTPKKLVARDARTAAFLSDTAQKIGCSLEIKKDIPVLDQAIEYYMAEQGIEEEEEDPEDIDPQEILETMKMLADLPDDLFNHLLGNQTIPQGMIDRFYSLEAQGQLDRDLAAALHKILQRLDALHGKQQDTDSVAEKNKPKTMKAAAKAAVKSSRSYIVSVSLGTGCYRHLRVPTDIHLDELADEILDAFGFDNDHLYSFFMDNKAWSEEAEYTTPLPEMEGVNSGPAFFFEDGIPADCITLEDALCRDDGKFLFLFDYGDDWRFSCRILRELDEPTDDCTIVRSKGKAPQQYPDDPDESI